MNLDLADEALEFGRLARSAIEAAGGDALLPLAESHPERREELAGPVLESLGAWQLDVRASPEELEAAAALCRAAGYWGLPYPVAERLCRPAGGEGDALVVVDRRAPAASATGLSLSWLAVTVDGRRSRARVATATASARKAALVAPLELEPLDTVGDAEVALALLLPCWTLLGLVDRALELTCRYVQDRQQFGQPLAGFQGVQFQLTDAEVERAGYEELARYALWSVETGRPECLDDVVALRLAALEAADVIFRVTHQLHGAIGFCDETTLSWLSRYSAAYRRYPTGVSATRDLLTQRISGRGLTGLFSPKGSA